MTSCTSTTCAFGRQCVPSRGPAPADIMYIGEAPGKDELVEGEPFVGAAGKLLGALTVTAGINPGTLRIANTCGCVDLADPTPTPKEIAACRPRLDQDIAEAQPKVIVLLGNTAIQTFFPGYKVGQIFNTVRALPTGVLVVPTYHPAASLRSGHKYDQTILEALQLAKRLALEVPGWLGGLTATASAPPTRS